MLDALGDLTEAASPPVDINLLLALSWSPDPTQQPRRVNWLQKINTDGFDTTINTLTQFKNSMAALNNSMSEVIRKYPSIYSPDLYRILGNPALGDVDAALNGYISSINILRSLAIPANSPVVSLALSDSAGNLGRTIQDFQRWRQTFVSQRSPAARKELEAQL
jgi:hypothetical protein